MELYINDILVDLNEKIPFPLTYSISDIKDLTARKGNNSKTITLPGTRTNYNLMLNVFSLTASENETGEEAAFFNYDPTIKVPARYYNEGSLEFSGVCQLQECVYLNGKWSFNVVLVSDTIDYMSRLSKIKVNELGWSEYNHALTKVNQENSWIGIVEQNGSPVSNYTSPDWDGFGYYYGIIDYGFERTLPDAFAVEQLAPQVFCREILDKAFRYCGISWSSNFLDSQRFKKLLLAWEGGDYPTIGAAEADDVSTYTLELNNESPGFIIDATQTSNPSAIGNTFGVWNPINVTDDYDCVIVQDTTGQAQNTESLLWVSASEGLFDVNYQGNHDVTINFSSASMTALYRPVGTIELYMQVIKNGFVIAEDLVWTQSFINPGTNTTFSSTATFDYTRTVDMLINDTLQFRLRAVTNQFTAVILLAGPVFTHFLNVQIETDGAVSLDIVKQQQQLNAGDTVNIASFLPSMDCATFFKGIVTAFNLYVKPSASDLTVMEIEPLNDFYNSSGDAVNWTDKVDRSKSISVVPTVNYASKNYNFRFADDDDYFNVQYFDDTSEQYGSHLITSQNQFSTGDTEFKLPFSQKPIVRIPIDDINFTDLIVPRNFQVKFKEDGTSEIVQKKGKPFLVQLGGLRTGSWIHIDEFGASNSESSYPYVGHLDDLDAPTFDLNWSVPEYVFYGTTAYTTNNLYLYHEKFLKEILDRYGKEVKLYVNLNSDDINRLDFRDLILIDSSVYRLQKVIDYDSGKNQSTQVELIRIIEGEGIQNYTVPVPETPLLLFNFKKMESGVSKVTEEGIIKRRD